MAPADIAAQFSPLSQVVGQTEVDNPLPADAALQYYPWFRFLGESVRDGHLPQWNPDLLGGVPVTPNGYVSSYYPPYLLSAVFGPLEGYTLFVLLHLAIGAIGVYAFARVLGVPQLASWIAGLCALGALHWVHWSLHLNHSTGMVWLPAVLAATEWAVARPTRRSAAVLALAFGLWWLGGGTQYTYYGTLAVVGYGAITLVQHGLRRGRWGRRLAASLGGGLLGAAIAAPLLLPTRAISDAVVRQREDVGAMTLTHLPHVDLLLLVMPDARGNAVAGVLYRGYPYGYALDTAFVGMTALLLACAGVASMRRRHVGLVVGCVAIISLGFTAWPHGLLYDLVPGYDRFRVSSRWLAALPAFALPLAGVGAAGLLGGSRRARIGLLAGAAAAAIAVVSYAIYVAVDPEAPHRFFAKAVAAVLLPLVVTLAGLLVLRRRPALAVGLLAASVLFEAAVHSATWFPSVPTRISYPDVPVAAALNDRGGRIARVSSELTPGGPFPPNLPMAYDVREAQGQHVLFPIAYDRYLRLIDDYEGFARDVNTAPPFRSPSMLSSPLVRLLDVRTALTDPNVTLDRPLVSSEGVNAYAVESFGPATLVPRARPATPDSMWAEIARPDWDPLAVANVLDLPEPVDGGPGHVSELSRSDAGERWRVEAPQGGLLRVGGNTAPGWRASIDGTGVPVYTADGIFRSVVVPPGTHEVEFSYRNDDEIRGRRLGAAALVVVALLLAPIRFRRRATEPGGTPPA